MSVWRSPSTGCQSPRAWPGSLLERTRERLLAALTVGAVFLPLLLAAPGPSVASPAPPQAVHASPRLEVLVLADGWVLRRALPLHAEWGPPLAETAVRRLGPGQTYIPRSGAAAERVLLRTARELLGAEQGVLQLRAGDRVPWRDLVRSAELLGPLRAAPGDALDGVLVDARPAS